MNMKEKGVPNFPLLFERVAHFLYEVHPVGAQQVKDHKMACEALDTIGMVIYPPNGICDSQPQGGTRR
jgi:hypothetical protein